MNLADLNKVAEALVSPGKGLAPNALPLRRFDQ